MFMEEVCKLKTCWPPFVAAALSVQTQHNGFHKPCLTKDLEVLFVQGSNNYKVKPSTALHEMMYSCIALLYQAVWVDRSGLHPLVSRDPLHRDSSLFQPEQRTKLISLRKKIEHSDNIL